MLTVDGNYSGFVLYNDKPFYTVLFLLLILRRATDFFPLVYVIFLSYIFIFFLSLHSHTHTHHTLSLSRLSPKFRYIFTGSIVVGVRAVPCGAVPYRTVPYSSPLVTTMIAYTLCTYYTFNISLFLLFCPPSLFTCSGYFTISLPPFWTGSC